MSRPIVVLLSGEKSRAVLDWAKANEFSPIYAFTLNGAAADASLGVEYENVAVELPPYFADAKNLNLDATPPIYAAETDGKQTKHLVLDSIVLITFAAQYALMKGTKDIAIGMGAKDGDRFPEEREQFRAKLEDVINDGVYGKYGGFTIHAPLMDLPAGDLEHFKKRYAQQAQDVAGEVAKPSDVAKVDPTPEKAAELQSEAATGVSKSEQKRLRASKGPNGETPADVQ